MPPNTDYSSIFNLGTYKTKYINYNNSSRYTSANDEVGDTFYKIENNNGSTFSEAVLTLDTSSLCALNCINISPVCWLLQTEHTSNSSRWFKTLGIIFTPSVRWRASNPRKRG